MRRARSKSRRKQPDHYRFDDGLVPLESDNVRVTIRGGGQSTVEERTYWHTPLGPVILSCFSVKWNFRYVGLAG